MKKLLFICTLNLQRSPTAAEIFKDKYETKSAGVGETAKQPLTAGLLEWADVVFVMEDWQRQAIGEKFPKQYLKKKIINLDIPDRYYYMDEELVKVLKEKIKRILFKI